MAYKLIISVQRVVIARSQSVKHWSFAWDYTQTKSLWSWNWTCQKCHLCCARFQDWLSSLAEQIFPFSGGGSICLNNSVPSLFGNPSKVWQALVPPRRQDVLYIFWWILLKVSECQVTLPFAPAPAPAFAPAEAFLLKLYNVLMCLIFWQRQHQENWQIHTDKCYL